LIRLIYLRPILEIGSSISAVTRDAALTLIQIHNVYMRAELGGIKKFGGDSELT